MSSSDVRDLLERAVDQDVNQLDLEGLTNEEVRRLARHLWTRQGSGSDDRGTGAPDRWKAFDHAPISIMICRVTAGDYPIEYVNPAFEELTGYEKEEVLNRDPSFLQGPDTEPQRADRMNEALDDGRPVTVEIRNYRKDGTSFWNRVTIAPLDGHDPDESHLIGFQQDVSERREMEETQRHRADLLEDINDSMPGVTYAFRRTPDGAYSVPHMSEGFEQLSGVTAEEAQRDFQESLKAVHPDDLKRVVDSIEQSADTLEDWTLEYRYQLPDGEIKWVQGSSVPALQPDGSIVWRGVLVDITEQKQLEQKLEASRSRYQALFEEAADPVLVENEEGVIEEVNQAAVDLLGMDRRDLVGSSLKNLLAPVERGGRRVGPDRGDEQVEERRDVYETVLLDDCGREILVEISEALIEHGDECTVLLFVRDLSRLSWTRRRMEALFNSTQSFLGLLDPSGRLLKGNRPLVDFTGSMRDELVGTPFDDLSLWRDRPDERAKVEDAVNTARAGDFVRIETRCASAAGDEHVVDVSLTPIRDDHDNVIYLVLEGRDVTRRKEAEEQLKEQMERTRRISRMKSNFVARTTHDLRTPLNSILGLTSLLEETDLTPEQKRELEGIRVAGQSMLHLVNDILDLDRIESGELELHPEPVRVRTLLDDVTALFEPAVRGEDVTLTARVEETVPEWIRVDPNRLKQILVNLVDNALKLTTSGRVDVRVDGRKRDGDRVTLAFGVADTGPGIPEEKRERIFRERATGDDFTTAEESGAGLGLSICQQLVRLMGGEMEVESEVGQGSTFTFTVQVSESEPKQGSAGTTKTSVSLENTAVLVVDDSGAIRNLISRLLKPHDVDVTAVSNGERALQEGMDPDRASAYDVVFLDRRLGDVSGLHVLEQFADEADAIDPNRVYVMTGDPESEIENALDDAHCAGVLTKPVSGSALLRSIRSVLRTAGDNAMETAGETDTDIVLPGDLDLLVVDDEREARWLLKKYLQGEVECLRSVQTGEDAVEERFRMNPNAVLMDLEMPGTDGLEATERIREREERDGLEPVGIIVQTARAMKRSRQKSLSAGADAFLKKPIDRPELFRVLSEVLASVPKRPE